MGELEVEVFVGGDLGEGCWFCAPGYLGGGG